MTEKASHSKARARTQPPVKPEPKPIPHKQTIEIAEGPNPNGHTDQAIGAHTLDDEQES